MLIDSTERLLATDPQCSYIVEAPAGSGKTEILTQRFLRLLGTVKAPEQIVALTFTRKAASEMRERIFKALFACANGETPNSTHQQLTFQFATLALEQDNIHHWQLLQQPNRLRIITIDALCQSLTRSIPLFDKNITFANIAKEPRLHYLNASRACIDFAVTHPSYQLAIKKLLMHVDNRQDLLLELLSDLLAKRDQWLAFFHQARGQDKKIYEKALSLIIQHEIDRFKSSIPKDCMTHLPNLLKQLWAINQSHRTCLDWPGFETLDHEIINAISSTLLTSQNTLRKAFDHHVGLKRGTCDDEQYQLLKTQSKALLDILDNTPEFLEALLRIKRLPLAHYDEMQWEVLQALFSILPLLAAYLEITFMEQNEVDFTAIAQQALDALGTEDNPTELALYIDNSIHHLLIDEFQDTSIQQFELISRIVQGWGPLEQKSLFVVGDPMQSIYRFRAAEVGLFLRAKEHGIGPCLLTPLALRSNFRSSKTIVNWVNEHFKYIFPATDDIESGAVKYHPSNHVKTDCSTTFIKALLYQDKVKEAQALVSYVKDELTQFPEDDIAILVRSRAQLFFIIRELHRAHVPFQGVDIDLLGSLPHLQDVWSLTKALLYPANRLSWLALLRSPWCGLAMADLLAIAEYSKPNTIYEALKNLKDIPNLSTEGHLRAGFIFKVLNHALTLRHQYPLVNWIIDTLKALHLEYTLDGPEQDDLDQFWHLLERFEHAGLINDLAAFTKELNRLYSKNVTPAKLQIMTIHRAKGLEFDCVFLPGLSTKSAQQDTPLMRWLALPTETHGELLLLSPIKALHEETCLLYNYLGQLNALKDHYELQRLLYVAATRAKQRLYLFDHSNKGNPGSCRHLLQKVPFIEHPSDNLEDQMLTSTLPTLYQLPITWYQKEPNFDEEILNLTPLDIGESSKRLIGIVAHELLEWISLTHPQDASDLPWQLAEHHLKIQGFSERELKDALSLLKQQFNRFFADPIAQWIIESHQDERNEYEFLVKEQQLIKTYIIDRVFCEGEKRWIIDFKTGSDDPLKTLEHRHQVMKYAEHFANNSEHVIHCGLYYLANNHWITWEYATQ
jgi:ATP-dependent helicase/nuclease subunit A